MARTRPLSQLTQDLRSGLSLATERVAYEITTELKKRGPYWSGDFEENWVVEAGMTQITQDVPSRSRRDVPEALDPQVTPPQVPPADDRLLGYTIGNRMEYADVAMDHVPGPEGYRWERAGSSAERDWFDRYLGGGEADKTIGNAVNETLRLAGFRR